VDTSDGRNQINGVLNPYRIIGGVSGGWSLVVVYENVSLPGKKITTFDGYAVIASGSQSLDIPISGFQSLPAHLPVNARLGVLALEGDYAINNDRLNFKANTNTAFTSLINPGFSSNTNYFNSSKSQNNALSTNRNPNSFNTLGWDAHLNKINNPLNTVFPNNETAAILQATTTQDKYDIFFASIDVEVIEPRVDVLKEAQSLSGINISNQSLNMGDEYFYKISFKNNGNDNAQNLTISDQLTKNVIFPISGNIQPSDIFVPQGVTYTYDVVLKKFNFTIPNTLVEKNDPTYQIIIRVKVETDCNNLEESCSNIISNQVFSSYQGILNPMIITNNPSSSSYNLCTIPIGSSTIVIANINQCVFSENESLCAGNITVLAAPNGYQSYNWSNGAITQNINISDFGIYTVTMNSPAPCNSITKTFNVIDCALSNENFNYKNFTFSPNPVSNILKISNDSAIDSIEVSSLLGQKIMSKSVNDLQTEIDLSQLTKGIYFVKINANGSKKTVKVVKE
jgi:large repetitive protein